MQSPVYVTTNLSVVGVNISGEGDISVADYSWTKDHKTVLIYSNSDDRFGNVKDL